MESNTDNLTKEQQKEWFEFRTYCFNELKELSVVIGKIISDEELLRQVDRMKLNYFKD